MTSKEPIAIVGIGCRLPGGIESPEQFWSFLNEGGDAIGDVPADRWDSDALFSADPATPGKTYVRRGGFLSGIERFDPAFFGISPREAAQIDPQQRLLLETAHEAVEDAGERWDDPALRNTGVFVGVFIHDYQHMQFADRELLSAHTGTGTAMSITANRISYCFDLRGPSVAVDTACSSSLVAIDMACKSLLAGECDFALAGGVNVILRPEMTIAMSKANMLSKDGSCKAFDASANGYVRGEGAGLVLLRRRSDVRVAKRRAYAMILGTGVNSDGRTKGISVPNGDAQEALMRRVLAEAGVAAATIQYVEAHGTGTPVGDPIEAGALGRVLREGRAQGDVCLLGSVKTNVGHLESASGAAGIIKTALCLKHGALVPNLHFKAPNAAIDLDALKLSVVVENRPWPASSTPRRAALNSFGFGGTNAHAVLEEVTEELEPAPSASEPALPRMILPMGAHDAGALRALAQGYAAQLQNAPECAAALLYTVSQRRSHYTTRAALVARDGAELADKLSAFARGELPDQCAFGERLESYQGRPVFVFSGMGPQWWGMARELLQEQSVFRNAVEEIDRKFQVIAGWSILEQLMAQEGASRINETNVAQPAIFAVQAGLTALWRHLGVQPAAAIGHSVGEVAALYAAGVLSLDDALLVAYHRSRLQQRTAGSGGMLAVGIDLARAAALLAGQEDLVGVGAVNGPSTLTLSGDATALARIQRELDAEGTFAKPLQVEVPYHSPKMDAIREELLGALAGLAPRPATCRYYSTTDGRTPQGTTGNAEYWWRNIRQTVLFADAVANALDDGHTCFLEVGPHPVLRSSLRSIMDARAVTGVVAGSLQRNRSDHESLAQSLAQLHVAGTHIDWTRLASATPLLALPLYPWQRAVHWSESKQAEQQRKGLIGSAGVASSAARHPLLGGRLDLPYPTWLQTLRLAEHRYLQDHKVQGAVVFPGTGYLEMALQTLAEVDRDLEHRPSEVEYFLLSDVEIERALYLSEEGEVRLETTRNGDRWSIASSSGKEATWLRHASGRCRREKVATPPERVEVEAIKARCSKPLASDYAYRLFRDVGLEYGATFQAIQELWYGPQESLARLELPAALAAQGEDGSRFLFHPALFDACLHTLFGALNLNGEDSNLRGNVFLPVSFRMLRVYRPQETKLFSHARIHSRSSRHFEADVRILDESGQLVAEVLDLRCQALEHPANVALKRRQEWMFEYQWSAVAAAERKNATPAGAWLLVASDLDHPLVNALRSSVGELIVAVPGARFERRGSECVLSLAAVDDFSRLLASVRETHGALAGVVHALSLSPRDVADPAAFSLQEQGACSLMQLTQALVLQPADVAAPRLWVLTQSSQPVVDGDAIRLAHGSLWGLRRVIANEHPQLAATILDLDGSLESWSAVTDELANPSGDDELALRSGQRFVQRLRRYIPEEETAAAPGASEARSRMELDVAKTGDLKSMRWIHLPDLGLAEREVEVEVHAAGVNFKDVMKATGLFPARLLAGNLWSKETLGMECAGVITRVGAAVRDLKPGDAVMALAPRSFASHVVTDAALVTPSVGLTPAEAAGIPVAFLTAAMALEDLAHLRPGERVLVHAASGGVGQAAIQIAQDIGAEIFATAGSDAKRELVRSLGVKHVFDSRSLRFAEEIREATNGQGVDVVLNSLAGEAITAGISVLRDYGRFIEIGKMDLDRDFPLGLRPFSRCLSFHALDLDRMLAQRVEDCGRVLASIHERIAAGRLRALPVRAFEPSQVADAYLLMAGAGHTGKLIVNIAPERAEIQPSSSLALRSDASYLITGGLGGFGYQLAEWLARRGAGNLVLLGRRGLETPGASSAMARLESLGARVQIEACDVADATQLRQALARIPTEYPLRGVFHAAAVLDDALIKNLDIERYRKTFAPKAAGAWYLHEQTLGCELDYFMCFSSMASILGNQGSANYCAANAFVDSLAHYRRSQHLPALTVNWGVIADVGMAADEDFYRQNLERNGLQTIHSHHCLEMLELLLQVGRVQTTVCPIDFATWLRFNPAGKESRLKELLQGAGQAASSSRSQAAEELALRQALEPLDAAARSELVEQKVREALAQVLRIEAGKIDSKRALTDLGADSLMAIEIKNRLEALGLAMSVTQLLNRNSVSTLAGRLLESLGHAHDDAARADGAPVREEDASKVEDRSWFVRCAPRAEPRLRLFCFPYAGGTSSVYYSWAEDLPEWIEVVAISLPGRGARLDEPNFQGIAMAADTISKEMQGLLDRPFALFGHCMGAIMMYEVAQRLQDEYGQTAQHIFASGCMAPHLYNSPVVHEQDDSSFLDVLRLISFSGTRALLEDADLRKRMFPLLRGDFRSVVDYGGGFDRRRALAAPITGIAADNDLFAAPKAMEAWDSYTSAGYELAQLRGDHYFVESDRKRVLGIVVSRLAPSNGEAFAVNAELTDVIWSKPSGSKLGRQPLKVSVVKPTRRKEAPAGATQVFCFPPAGIPAEEFTIPDSDSDTTYTRVEWHGESARALRSMDQLVERAYAAVQSRREGPTIFYGHCLGAIVAYELTLRLQRENRALPDQLLVAGVVGPHLYVAPNAHRLPNEKLLELLSVLHYPLVSRLREDRGFLEERMALIRADLEAMATYEYEPAEAISVPITAISFRHDLWSYPLRTGTWGEHTHARCRVEEWQGDHYASMQQPQRIHELIRVLCKPGSGKASPSGGASHRSHPLASP